MCSGMCTGEKKGTRVLKLQFFFHDDIRILWRTSPFPSYWICVCLVPVLLRGSVRGNCTGSHCAYLCSTLCLKEGSAVKEESAGLCPLRQCPGLVLLPCSAPAGLWWRGPSCSCLCSDKSLENVEDSRLLLPLNVSVNGGILFQRLTAWQWKGLFGWSHRCWAHDTSPLPGTRVLCSFSPDQLLYLRSKHKKQLGGSQSRLTRNL